MFLVIENSDIHIIDPDSMKSSDAYPRGFPETKKYIKLNPLKKHQLFQPHFP